MEGILVVDDDSIILQLMKRILDNEGIESVCVSSGEEALEQIEERSFSLMITDYNMPGLNGIELSRRGLEMAPQMPIILNTSGITQKIARLAMETGISKVMAKPYLPDEMLESIRAVAGKRRVWASPVG